MSEWYREGSAKAMNASVLYVDGKQNCERGKRLFLLTTVVYKFHITK